MSDSTREAALKALHGLLSAISWPAPAPKIARNEPEAVDGKNDAGARGLVSLRDGDPGEPEVYLSPAAYAYSHRAEIVVAVSGKDADARDARVDALLRALGAALVADPTLGGAVEMATPEAPEFDLERDEGTPAMKTATVGVVLEYVTASPLL